MGSGRPTAFVTAYRVSVTCPSCAAPTTEGARFCSECGAGLTRGADERRVATVLFGDLVGFTAMSENLDPETVKRTVDRCFGRLAEDIVAFGGRVDKVVGDGIVALFGAPVAHENDAERAVRAALRMQQTMAEQARENGVDLRMRIGVNTGEVLVGAIAADGDYTAMGDVVNTASRLQELAEPGRVVVGPATHAATERVISYQPSEIAQVKGRDESVETWVAQEALLPPGYRPDRPTTPLVGREPEFRMLAATVSAAIETRRPAFILVVGDAGLGKTRLVQEVLGAAAEEHDAVTLGARCVPYGEANVWWPIAELLREGFRIDDETTPEEIRSRILDGARRSLPAGTEEAHVVDVSQGLFRLLGLEAERVDTTRARDEAVRAAAHIQRAQTRRQPLLIRIADLHWADDVVLDYLDELIGRLGRSPVVYLCTARASIEERWQPKSGRHNTVVLNLDPLGEDAAQELLDHLAPDVDPAMARVLIDRSGGNPFFLEELITLLDDGPEVDLEAPAMGAAPRPGLPDTLRGLLSARIDALAPEVKAVLQDASVFGSRGVIVGLSTMAQALGRSGDVDEALKVLVAKEMVTLPTPDRWAFRNDMMREVTYNTLTKADRASRHFGIAKHLAGDSTAGSADVDGRGDFIDVIAHHLATAAELARELGSAGFIPVDAKAQAIEWLTEAGRRANNDGHYAVSEAVHRRALALAASEHPGRATLLLGYGQSLSGLGEFETGTEVLGEARGLAADTDDALLMAEADRALGELLTRQGDYHEAVDLLGRALDSFRSLGENERAASALREMGLAHLFLDEMVEAEREVTRSLDLFADIGDERGGAWALQNLAWIALNRGQLAVAEERIDASVEKFTGLNDAMGLAWAEGLRAFLWFQQGRFVEAEAIAAEVGTQASTRGDTWAAGMMRTLRSLIALWQGRTQDAVVEAQAALDGFGDTDVLQGRLQAAACLGRALVMSGQVDGGFRVFDQYLESSDRSMFVRAITAGSFSSAAYLGEVDLARKYLPDEEGEIEPLGLGDREATLHLALLSMMEDRPEAAAELLAKYNSGDALDPFASALSALLAAMEGDHERALATAAAARGEAMATYSDRSLAWMVTGLVRASRGEVADAIEAFANSKDEVASTGDVVSKAISRLGAARALTLMSLEGSGAAESEARGHFADIGATGQGWIDLLAAIT